MTYHPSYHPTHTPQEKLELSTEQLAYLNCSDYFRKKSGFLVAHAKWFSNSEFVLFGNPPPKVNLGLDSFLKEWTGSFGYCSDCSLSFHGPSWPSPTVFNLWDTEKAQVVAWTPRCWHCRAYSTTNLIWLSTCPLVSRNFQINSPGHAGTSDPFFCPKVKQWAKPSSPAILGEELPGTMDAACFKHYAALVGGIVSLKFHCDQRIFNRLRHKTDMFDKDTISLKRKAWFCSVKWNIMSASLTVRIVINLLLRHMPAGGLICSGISLYSFLAITC